MRTGPRSRTLALQELHLTTANRSGSAPSSATPWPPSPTGAPRPSAARRELRHLPGRRISRHPGGDRRPHGRPLRLARSASAQGQHVWRAAPPVSWTVEVDRFFTALARFDTLLATEQPAGLPWSASSRAPSPTPSPTSASSTSSAAWPARRSGGRTSSWRTSRWGGWGEQRGEEEIRVTLPRGTVGGSIQECLREAAGGACQARGAGCSHGPGRPPPGGASQAPEPPRPAQRVAPPAAPTTPHRPAQRM